MFNYNDIGKKIKSWAVIVAIVQAILSVISGIYVWSEEIDLLGPDSFIIVGPLLIILGPISAWISSWILYGFGEIVDAALVYKRSVNADAGKQASSKTITVHTSDSARRCSFCGAKLENGATFCEKCGEKVSTSTQEIKKKDFNSILSGSAANSKHKSCPHCGDTVTSGICTMCGKPNDFFK